MNVSLEQVDRFLERVRVAQNDDEMRRIFQDFDFGYDIDLPADPFSNEYRTAQFALYEYLHGRPYTTENEASALDVEQMAVRPFPYCHGSSELVGNHLLAIGFIIKAMGLRPGAKVLEFGPGWGNTTLLLAKMGYKVTAVDIEQNFVDLIRARAAMEKLEVNVLRGDFSLIHSLPEKFDAIVFFECFHHAADHLGLMAGFDSVLEPGGLVCFGAEPITDDFPIPWGLRMDGESIWAIRNNGWLELGYNRRYFDEALKRHGFAATEHVGSDGPWSKALIARRTADPVATFSYQTGKLKHEVGSLTPRGLQVNSADRGYVMFGPYERLGKGRWEASIIFDENSQRSGELVVDVVDRSGDVQISGPRVISLNRYAEICTLEFFSDGEIEAFELRLVTPGNCRAVLREMTLRYLG